MKESDHLLVIHGKRQGQRTDIEEPRHTCDEVVNPNDRRTDTIIGEKIGMGRHQYREASIIWEKAKGGDERAGKLIKEIDTGKRRSRRR